MRKSNVFLFLIAAEVVLLCLFFLSAAGERAAAVPRLQMERELVREYGLTDLCLFTEARYTRHATQSDLHTPFQDSPLSFDHFPTAAYLPPPEHLRTLNSQETHVSVD